MAYYHNGVGITLNEALKITRRIFTDEFDSPPRKHSPIRKRSVSPIDRKGEITVPIDKRFHDRKDFRDYSDLAEKNALELIAEEEQAKFKAERKKAKKERQKEKKKQACTSDLKNNDNCLENICNNINNTTNSPESAEPEELDVNAAFVSKSIKKAKNPVQQKIQKKIQEDQNTKKQIKDIESKIQLGLEYEKKEHFKEAIQYYSEVLNLAPKSVDILLKRSLIYYKVAKFEQSIRDAKKVLQLSSNNVEAYYRIGEGNFALNNITEAEEAFTSLINLNSHTESATKRLIAIHVKQLEDMGFNANEAFTALLKSKNKTLDEAIEYLSNLEKVKNVPEDLYYSDEEESEEDDDENDDTEEASGISEPVPVPVSKPTIQTAPLPTARPTSGLTFRISSGPIPRTALTRAVAPVQPPAVKPVVVLDKNSPMLKDSTNPFGCSSLFVGNLKKGITYRELHNVFIRFGDIASIKLITEPNCYAFVNYQESGSAGCAMEGLQGSHWLLSTEPLVVKFPLKALSQAIPPGKQEELSNVTKKITPSAVKENRVRPKPQTEECYFWQTTGCTYGDACFYLHIPEHKGVALKDCRPFHARLGRRAAKPS